eukprot:272231-Chlamydomonas_euryale.AAC.3
MASLPRSTKCTRTCQLTNCQAAKMNQKATSRHSSSRRCVQGKGGGAWVCMPTCGRVHEFKGVLRAVCTHGSSVAGGPDERRLCYKTSHFNVTQHNAGGVKS